MDAPICQRVPSCGTKHWPRQDCPLDTVNTTKQAVNKPVKAVSKSAVVVTPAKVVVTPKPMVVTDSKPVVTDNKVVVTQSRSKDRHKGSRAEYMREYRKRA